MEQEWVGKSLTIWGVIISFLTAVVPAIGLLWPDATHTITPEWIAGLNQSVSAAITGIGAAVGAVMVIVDRLSGNTAKTLVLRRPD